MKKVNILEIEITPMGEMADVVLERSFEPSAGMILMDEESKTWQVTGMLSDAKRVTPESVTRRWTFRVEPVNSDVPLHTGEFKLLH